MADDGDLVAGRYRLWAKAGLNEFGEVWRARDEQLGRDVAVKPLVSHRTTGKAALRAMREARVAARLSHPHAVIVYDVVDHAGKPCLVMELLPTCLARVLAERGQLPQGMVAKIGSQIAAALAVAHADGVVHRDVSPGNVLLTRDGTAKIADFGISRALGEPTVTDQPFVPGTPAYLAPEVAGDADATTCSDVYSLGATLYTALEEHPPVGAGEEDMETLLARIAAEEIVAPIRTGPLTNVLLQLLRRDPALRPTMAEAAELLARASTGPRPTHSPVPVVPRPTRRRRIVLVAVAFGVIAGCAAGAVAVGSASSRSEVASPETVLPPAPSSGRVPGNGIPSGDTAGCVATAQVTQSWSGGYKTLVTVQNVGPVRINGWTVTWRSAAGRRVDDLWDGKIERSGASVTVVNETWNSVVTVEGTTSFGLITLDDRTSRITEPLTCRPL